MRDRYTSALVLMLTACSAAPSATPEAATAEPSGAAVRELVMPGPMYAAGAQFDGLVFTSGHLPDNAGESFEAQVENVLYGLEASLEASGAGLDTLLKVNVYLADWDDWETFNAVYVDRLDAYGLPPRATVQVARLGLNAPIEIEAIAHVRATAP